MRERRAVKNKRRESERERERKPAATRFPSPFIGTLEGHKLHRHKNERKLSRHKNERFLLLHYIRASILANSLKKYIIIFMLFKIESPKYFFLNRLIILNYFKIQMLQWIYFNGNLFLIIQ